MQTQQALFSNIINIGFNLSMFNITNCRDFLDLYTNLQHRLLFLMNSKIKAIVDLFKSNECLNDFDKCEIDEIASCKNQETLQKIFSGHDEDFKESFEKELRVILSIQPQAEETEEQKQQKYLQKKIMELQDLMKETNELRKMADVFSYKSLKILELYAFIRANPKLQELPQFDLSDLDINTNFKKQVKNLRESIIREGRNSTLIDESLKRIQSENIEEIDISIQKIKDQLIAIDIDQLDNLVGKNKNAQAKVANKSGVVFIGVTGAGKSTTILGLLGHEMVIKQWEQQQWVTPKFLLDIQGIENLVANPSSRSVTRNVTSVQLPKNMIDELSSDILFLDTPGFNDTQGSTIQLSNSFGAAAAIKSLKCARFVIILSGKDHGSRHTGIKEMISILNKLFPNYNEVKNCITIIFNRYNEQDLKSMKGIIDSIWSALPGSTRDDANLKSIYNDLATKTKNQKEILIFNPVNQKPDYAKSFVNIILNSAQLDSLEQNFSVTYGDTATRNIEKQVSIFRDLCLLYFEHENIKICRYFLQQLRKFYEIMGKKESPEIIQFTINTIETKINSIINNKYEKVISSFNRAIETNSLMQVDVNNYFEQIKKFKEYENLKQIVRLVDIETTMIENAHDKIKLAIYNIKKAPVVDDKMVKSLRILLKGFQKQDSIKQIKEHYQQLIEKQLKQYDIFLNQGNFEGSLENYQRYNSLYQNLINFCQDSARQKGSVIDDLIIKHIKNKQDSLQYHLERFSDLQKEHFEKIQEVSAYLTKLDLAYDYLRIIKNTELVKKALQSFNKHINQKAQNYLSKVEEYLAGRTNLDEGTVKKISKLYRMRDHMKNIPHLKTLIINKSNSIDNRIKNCLEYQGKIIEGFIDKIPEKKVNYTILKREINGLDLAAMRMDRVLKFCQTDQENIIEKMNDKLNEFFEYNIQSIKESAYDKLDLTNDEIQNQIPKLGEVLEILEAFNLGNQHKQSTKQKNIKDVTESNIIKELTETKVQSTLEKIAAAQKEKDMYIQNSVQKENENKMQENEREAPNRSRLFQNKFLISQFNQLKHRAQSIFTNNIDQIKVIVKKINSYKSDNSNQKGQKLNLKQIESCIKFILMGKKIFNTIPQKKEEFKKAEDQIVKEIVKWEERHVESIKKDFEDLKTLDIESLKIRVKVLKRNIETLKQINLNFPLIHKILDLYQKNFLDQEFQNEISYFTQYFEKTIQKEQKNEIITLELSKTLIKCRYLSALDYFIEPANQFDKMEKNLKEKIHNKNISVQKKFSCALQTRNYDDIVKYLKQMNDVKSPAYQDSEANVLKQLQKEIVTITQQKIKGYELQSEIQKIIQDLNKLIHAKNALSDLGFCDKHRIDAITTKINTVSQSMSKKIETSYSKLAQQTKNCIDKKNLEDAYINLVKLQKLQNILDTYQAPKDIKNNKKHSELKHEVDEVIDTFRETFLTNTDTNQSKIFTDNQKFIDDYNAIFEKPVISFEPLLEQKRKIDRFFEKLVDNEMKKIVKMNIFTGQNLNEIKSFISKFPQSFRKNTQKLQQEAKQRVRKYNQSVNNMIQQSQKHSIFDQGGNLDPRTILYINDDYFSKQNKIIQLNKIKIQLEQKIKEYEANKNLLSFFKRTTTCQFLRYPQNTKQDPVSLIIEVYDIIYEKINKTIIDLLADQLKELDLFLIDPSKKQCQQNVDTKLKQFINQTILFVVGFQEKQAQIFFRNVETVNAIIFRYQKFIERIIKYFKNKLNQVNINKCLELESQRNEIMKQIENIKKVKITENFIVLFLQKIQNSEHKQKRILKLFLSKFNSLKSDFALNKYKLKIEEGILSKFDRIAHFSLKGDTIMRMDELEIQNELKQKYIYINYITMYFDTLSKLVGISEIDSETKINGMKQLKSKFQKQSEEIAQEIDQFVKVPSFEIDKIDKINKRLTVLDKHSVYKQKFKNSKQNFLKQIKTNYEKIFEEMMPSIKQQKKKIQDEIDALSPKQDQVDEKMHQKEQQENDNLKKKLEQMEKEHTNKLNGLSPQQTENHSKIYNGQVENEKTLLKQNLIKFKQQISKELVAENKRIEELEKQFFKVFAKKYENMVNITQNLLSEYSEKNNDLITEVKNVGKKKWLKLLVDALDNIGSSVTQMIIASNKDLQKLSDTHFKKNIQTFTIETILNKLVQENEDISQNFKNNLYKKFHVCEKSYCQEINLFEKSQKNERCEYLVSELKKKLSNKSSLDKKLKILSQIFALWTIITSQQEDGNKIYTYKPHPVQILTAIMLLGLTDMKQYTEYKNRFAEIKTGEGKSLILAVLCTFFALNDYEIDCVCYSENLSSRDRDHFYKLFTTLGIQKKIKYCTFNDLTEGFINNNQINLRKNCLSLIQSKQLVKQNNITSKYNVNGNNKVLLMDQADVFFIDEFYGNTYSPSIELKSQKIKSLYNYIWSQRDEQTFDIKTLIAADQYKNLIDEFPQFADLIRNHLPHMIIGMKNYKHDYQLIKQRICYKSQDGFSDKISYGYKTVFAYFYEYSRNAIPVLPTQASSIEILLCDISYAELPKMYDYIVGVTGTLKNLSKCQKDIMKNQYKVQQNYIIPSVYKASKRNDCGYRIVEKSIHYQEIIKNLSQYNALKRPVIVFFNSLQDAIRFYEDSQFKKYREDSVILNQKNTPEQRKIRINRAMIQGKISLITKSFARGINFVIYDKKVIEQGGVHLICAYVIQQKSEEVQILGRVGRQGDPASSIFFVTQQQLESKLKLILQQADTKNPDKIQKLIDQARQSRMNQKQASLNKILQKCTKKHSLSIDLFTSIISKQFDTVLKTIIQSNLLPEIVQSKPVKTVLAIDATSSMEMALNKTKESLTISFQRVYKILQDNKVSSGFEMQIVAYRNYNLQEKQLIQVSPFENHPEHLISFIKTIEAAGGWGNEALEVAFDHCLTIEDLKQIIIITDAKFNTKQETIQKRKNTKYGYGDQYWKNTIKFSKPFDCQELFEQLKSKEIIIHSLPIEKNGKNNIFQYYEALSKQSRGKCESFNPQSQDATKQLTDFISLSILEKLGGDKLGLNQELIESYRKAYRN